MERQIENNGIVAYSFRAGAAVCNLSEKFLRNAADDPDPKQRLRTYRVGRRRLIRPPDLLDWFNRVARPEKGRKRAA